MEKEGDTKISETVFRLPVISILSLSCEGRCETRRRVSSPLCFCCSRHAEARLTIGIASNSFFKLCLKPSSLSSSAITVVR